MLHAKDLIVGDWVLYHEKPYPILGIKEDDESIYRCLITGPEGFDWWIKIADFQPIPLTPEILEKNGFDINGIPEDMQPVEERDWSDDTYVWSGQKTQVSVYMDDPNNFFAEIICQYCHVDGVHIKYVHELQHALRLCGIEKEIEL